MATPFSTSPFERESMEKARWRSEVQEEAGRLARKFADDRIEQMTAELRAELAVQKAVVEVLAQRLAIKLLPPEA